MVSVGLVESWDDELGDLLARVAGRFTRAEPRKRALAAAVPFTWFTADEAYGQNPGLRGWLEEQDIAYVDGHPRPTSRKRGTGGDEPALIPLSSNEIRRLLGTLVLARQGSVQIIVPSRWPLGR